MPFFIKSREDSVGVGRKGAEPETSLKLNVIAFKENYTEAKRIYIHLYVGFKVQKLKDSEERSLFTDCLLSKFVKRPFL